MREKKNLPPGRKSDFSGEKADWLDTFKQTILGAATKDEVGVEYTDIANRFILRYGYDLPFSENVVGDPTLNPPNIPPPTTEEEKARRTGIRSQLRTKLGNWYRSRYRNKKSNGGAIKQVLTAMQSMSGASQRPRRKSSLMLYSKLHYDERVKPTFDAIWAKAKDSLPGSMRVSMVQDCVRTCWEAETEEFKKGIEDQCAAIHEEALSKWKAGRQWDSFTAEEYHDALESMEDVAIPLADALAEKLGMHIVILAVGPVGSEEGGVRLRTVFSDTADGATSKTWSQLDHRGFTAMEASITRYGNTFFTKAECDARAWPPLAVANPALNADLLQLQQGTAPMPPPPPAPAASGTAPAPPPPPTPAASGAAPAPPASGIAAAPPDTPTDGIDRSEWNPNLVEVYAYLSSKHWGPKWDELLARLLQFEWSNYFHDDMGKIQKITHRPEEIGEWMKRHRVADDFPLNPALTPGFGERLLAWWQDLGPKDRWKDVQGLESPLQEEQKYEIPHRWKEAVQYGRNGIQLLVFALAWWGQDIWNKGSADGLGGGEKALDAAADWQRLSQDVSWFLSVSQRERDPEEAAPEPENTAAKKGRGKGKGKMSKAEKDKEGPEKEKEKDATGTETTAKKRKKRMEGEGTAPAKRRRRGEADTPADSAPAADQPRPKPKALFRKSARGVNPSTDGTPVPETSVSTSPAAQTPTAKTGAAIEPGIVNGTVNAESTATVNGMTVDPATAVNVAAVVGNSAGNHTTILVPSIIVDPAVVAPNTLNTSVVNAAVEPATTVDLPPILPVHTSVEAPTTVDPSLILPVSPSVEDDIVMQSVIGKLGDAKMDAARKDDDMDLDLDDGLTPEERAEMLADPDADEEE